MFFTLPLRFLRAGVDQTVNFKISHIAPVFIATSDVFGFHVFKNDSFIQFTHKRKDGGHDRRRAFDRKFGAAFVVLDLVQTDIQRRRVIKFGQRLKRVSAAEQVRFYQFRFGHHQLKLLGAPAVGLWGTSYGAWISAMALTLDPGFDGALLLEPPVEIEELFWEMPLFSNLQKELTRLKIPRERVQQQFRLVTPYHYPLRIDPSRVLILGSAHDPIGHPESLKRLHQAWPGSYLEIFPYGHISYRLHTSAVERFLSVLAPKLATVSRVV